MAQFRLVLRSGPVVGKVFPLETPEIYMGRESTNQIVINDAQVSRRHAKLELRGTTYLIQDLGSTNGTFVNGTRLSGTQALNNGDIVALGEGIVLSYEIPTDMNATVVSTKPPETVVQKPAPVPTPVPPAAPAPTPAPPPAFRSEVPPEPVPTPAAPPTFRPAVPPAPPPEPAPVYSGKVPAGPVPMPPASAPKKKKFPVWIIIVIILLVIICACVGLFLIIDQFSLWCKVVPFLVPLLGGTC